MRKQVLVSGLALALLSMSASTQAAQRPDPWITMKTKMALLTTPDAPGLGVNVDTYNGVVTLHGTVETKAQARKAVDVASGIEGVSKVRDLLVVSPGSRPASAKAADAQIKTDVRAALDNDVYGNDVQVTSVTNGVVVLSGTPVTMSERARAIRVASRVPGVVRVESRMTGPEILTDDEIWQERRARRARMAANASTPRGEGESSTKEAYKDAKDATKEAWHDTKDATKEAYKDAKDATKEAYHDAKDATKETKSNADEAANDLWITSAVKMRLLADADTPGLAINVDTDDGVVTLFGTVPTEASKTRATEEARKVEDVVKVVNALQVVPESQQQATKANDDEIEAAIRKAVSARPGLKGSDIDVDVENGVARLTGTIDTRGARLEALQAVRGVAGVRSIRDELKLSAATPKGG